MGSLVALPAMKALEAAFNRYLALDPDAPRYLQPLLGKVVMVDVTGLGTQLIFIFNQRRVEICHEFASEPDVVIRGAPVSLVAVASGRTGLMQSEVSIDGEVDTANCFSHLLERIDIDWEEHVATIAGDKTAHLLGRFKSGATDWVQQFHSGMERNVADYLRDETRYLPHQWEMNEFIDEVDSVRDRVDLLLQKARAMGENER